jgi:hypothetical protein
MTYQTSLNDSSLVMAYPHGTLALIPNRLHIPRTLWKSRKVSVIRSTGTARQTTLLCHQLCFITAFLGPLASRTTGVTSHKISRSTFTTVPLLVQNGVRQGTTLKRMRYASFMYTLDSSLGAKPTSSLQSPLRPRPSLWPQNSPKSPHSDPKPTRGDKHGKNGAALETDDNAMPPISQPRLSAGITTGKSEVADGVATPTSSRVRKFRPVTPRDEQNVTSTNIPATLPPKVVKKPHLGQWFYVVYKGLRPGIVED